MTVSVLIPFAGDDAHRLRALDWVASRYAGLDYEVVVGYGDPDAWSKGDAVADALERAQGDTLVVADADCWCDSTARVVAAVEAGAPWGKPYRIVHRLTREASEAVYAGATLDRNLKVGHDAPVGVNRGARYKGIVGGGIVILRRDLYKQAPLDRRFVGWGGEDHAWGYALETFGGRVQQLRDICWHLWHPPQRPEDLTGVSGTFANEQLRRQYKAAKGDMQKMRELIGVGMRGNATVVRVRTSPERDVYGSLIDPTPSESELDDCTWAPGTSEESSGRRDGIVVDGTLYTPPDADVVRTDQMRVNGDLYDVAGEPQFWASPFTQRPQGIAIPLRRAEG